MIIYKKPFKSIEEIAHIDRIQNLRRLKNFNIKPKEIDDGKNKKLNMFTK